MGSPEMGPGPEMTGETEKPLEVEGKTEKEPQAISLTAEEYETLKDIAFNPEDPAVIKLMAEKGITFDSEPITIDVAGDKRMVTTEKGDFFTTIHPETFKEKFGGEK